jgi:uncharacterized repeat protein (TIGR01451 family)
VTTNKATNISKTGATLSATINPNGASTTLNFDYGLTTNYGSTVSESNIGSGTSTVTQTLSGLDCGTTYHFRANATNSAGSGYGNDQTFTTNDCQPGTLQFSSSPSSVTEDSATLTMTVTRTEGSDGALLINYTTSNGTATAGSDYTMASDTLIWADGETAAKTITITLIDDNQVETDETFMVSLSNVIGGARLGTPSSVLVTLTDNDTVSCSVQTDIPEAECDTLVALYNQTNGATWLDSTTNNWTQTTTPCSWTGVTCSGGQVTQISRSSQGLNGNLPDLSALTALQIIDLSANQLTGTIPTELGNQVTLTELDLSNNQLTGSIPTELGNLVNLTDLNLSANQLTGTIPTEFGNLVTLTQLDLSDNQLTGSIPSVLGNLVNLIGLNLSINQLTGTIPAELDNLATLTQLDLSMNQLTGTIPTELGNLVNLTGINLSANQLTGAIPAIISNLIALTQLDLGYNLLTGSIPTELDNLVNLIGLNLSTNQLTGTIPAELGNLVNLTTLWLDNNQLTGSIPAELGNLVNLTTLWLDNNQLTGTIPTEFGNLVNLISLDLSANQLSGNIPASLASLTNINQLDIGYNSLTTFDVGLINYLNSKDADWADTQIAPPTNVRATATAIDTVQVSWTPIADTSTGGYYQVKYATTSGGPYTNAVTTTADQLATSYDVTGLSVGTTYYFVVVSVTPAQGSQSNDFSALSNEATATWVEETAELSITQQQSVTPIIAGTTFSYLLSVTNNGPELATGVQVTDTLPSGLTYISATGTDWTCSQSNVTVSCTLADTLTNGATAPVITIQVTAPSTATSLNNSVTVSALSIDTNTTNNSVSESTSIAPADTPNQAPVLSPLSDQTLTLGDTLSITVSATDADGDNLSFSLGSPLSGATIDASSGEWTWTPGTTGTFNQTISVADDGLPPLSDEQTISITVNPVNQAPILENLGNQAIALGNTLNFTASAADPDGNHLTFSLDNAPAGATIDANSGIFTWTPDTADTFNVTVIVTDDGVIPLTDQETLTITVSQSDQAPPVLNEIGNQAVSLGSPFSLTASATDSDGDNLTFSLDNAPTGATIEANTGRFNWTPDTLGTFNATIKVTDDGIPPLSDEETISITVVPATNLSITQTASSQKVVAGGQMTYTLTVHNAGPEAANMVKVEDTLSTAVIYNSATGTDWTCAEDSGSVTCELPSLAAGATANPITVNVTVSDTVSDTLNNSVSVSAANADPDETNNQASEDITVVTKDNQSPTLNSLANQSIVLGDSVSFTASATDPDGDKLTFSLEKAPSDNALIDSTTGVFGWIPDSYGTFDITVKVTDDGYPPLSAQKSFTITVASSANLKITQQTDAMDWITTQDSLTYTLMVNNLGPDIATNVTVVDTLPADVSYISASGTGWACQKSQRLVTCVQASLEAAATAPPLRVTVLPTACGTFSHTASVSSATAESDDSNDQVSDDFTVKCLLAAKPSPTRSGSVQVEPAQKAYSLGETVTLTATPNSCYELSRWEGACEGSEAVCTLTMNANTEATALFEPKVLAVTTSADNGTIAIEPAQTEYRCYDEITLTANSALGYTFLGWSDDLTGQENPRELRLTENLNISAIFGEPGLSITPLKVNAYPGQNLTFQASGGKGDFFWAATQGSLAESGNNATYVVPEQRGVFYVWVTDGEGFAWALVETPADATEEQEMFVLLRIVPNAINLSVGETQTVSVKGYRINGTSVDLTAESLLRSENTDIVQVNSDGQVTARAYGKTRLTARYRELHTDIPITVQDETSVLKVEPNVLILYEGSTALVNVYSVSSLGAKNLLDNARLKSRDSWIAAVTQGVVRGIETGSTWLEVEAGETSLQIPIVVRPSPKLDITPAVATVEQGESVMFSLTGGQPPYQLAASDGSSMTQVDNTFSYQPLTTGMVTLSVTDSLGRQTEAEVETVASLKVTPERAVVKRGDDLELRATGGAEPYTWSVTQGELSDNEGEQVAYTASTRSGLHTVTVTDNIGNSQDIIILVGDELSLSQQQLFLVPNGKAKIQILGGVSDYTVTVTGGQAMIDDDGQTVNYTAPEVAGVYTLTVSDSQGNKASAEIMVTLELLITPAAGRVDAGESLTFQAAGGVGDKRWFATQGIFDQNTGDAVVWTAPNHFGTVHINVNDAAGATATATIEVSSHGLAITPSVRHIHPGESAELTVTGGGAPYTWQSEGGDYTEIADDTIRYIAPLKKGTYQVTVQDAAGKEAQAQAKVYSTRLLASPKTLYIRPGETLKITIGGGTGDYPGLTARFGELKDTKLSLPNEQVSITTEYTAPNKYEQVYDTITIRDSGGNLATIDVEMTKNLDIISTYVGEDGQLDNQEMEKALEDFFNQQFWLINRETLLLDRETLFLITEKFLNPVEK